MRPMVHECGVCGRRQVAAAERCGRCGGPILTPKRLVREVGVVAAVTTVHAGAVRTPLAVVDLDGLSVFCTIRGGAPSIGDGAAVVSRDDGGFVAERLAP